MPLPRHPCTAPRPVFRLALLLAVLTVAPAAPSGSAADERPAATAPPPTRGLRILYPFDETLFPPDLAPPTFRWDPGSGTCDGWRIRVDFLGGAAPVEAVTRETHWSPEPGVWDRMKNQTRERAARFSVRGFLTSAPDRALSQAEISFSTSADEVQAPIFYRDVNLPFIEAVKDPSDIRWRFGNVAATNPPPVVLERMPVCGNCHSFSRDGGVLGMDVDYANSKGSYVITRTAREMSLVPQEVITWDDFRRDDGELTFGLLSQVSPDGRWIVSTVKDKSVFVPRPDLAFSQLFFPIRGFLAVYNRERRSFAALPGADDPAFVQSNPAWSPDGQFLIFARAKAHDLSATTGQGKVLLTADECREFLKDGKPFLFDLYRIPFNDGRGGVAEPLSGASRDGLSNYFPKYSPDGRWIVFCKAKSYMLLQPDSELHLIPAEGGTPRRLRANLPRMNSWHSWSPNGRWLVFSSKGFSDYTQLFLTHIDSQGESTPPVLLERFTATNRAANIPEFVNLPADGITRIQGRFLNDYSFERAGNELYRGGEPERAIEKYRQALELNPENVVAHQRLGFLLGHVKRQAAEGLKHTQEALRLDPRNGFAHSDLGVTLLSQNRPAQAIEHLRTALELLPQNQEARYQPQVLRGFLGKAYLQERAFPQAADQFRDSLRLDPDNPEMHYLLALALACQGDTADATVHYTKAVGIRPDIDTSAALHELLAESHAKAGRFDDAIRSAERAIQIARAAGKNDFVERIQPRLARYRAQRDVAR